MSLPEREPRPGRLESEAAEWVARCDTGLSEEQRREFEHWRGASPENRQAFERLSSAWAALGRPLRTGASDSLLQELDGLRRRDRRRRMRAASAVTVLVCLLGSVWWIRSNRPVVEHLPANAVVIMPERRVLEDGSTVESARGTELEIAYSPAVRRVHLKRGDAHFQVTSNPARPFVVSVHGIDVEAVGTAFAVRAQDTRVDVVVTEGRVEIEEGRSGLPPRSLAVLDKGTGLKVDVSSPAAPAAISPVHSSELAERLAWRSPRVEFSGVPLRDVVVVLNRFNATRLVVDDPAVGDVLLSGLFRADDTDSLLNTLEVGFGIAAERRGKQILLRRAK